MAEVWKQIAGHPNHYVSNLGNVKSADHTVTVKGYPSRRKGKMFKLTQTANGYLRVCIEKRWYYVHRLVATAFLAPVEGKDLVNHLNGCKNDNRADNLEWATASENGLHAYATGLNVQTEERRAKIAKAHTGMKASEETRKKIGQREYKRGYKLSDETKDRISKSITEWHKQKQTRRCQEQD